MMDPDISNEESVLINTSGVVSGVGPKVQVQGSEYLGTAGEGDAPAEAESRQGTVQVRSPSGAKVPTMGVNHLAVGTPYLGSQASTAPSENGRASDLGGAQSQTRLAGVLC